MIRNDDGATDFPDPRVKGSSSLEAWLKFDLLLL
jgi:hypothetical protein